MRGEFMPGGENVSDIVEVQDTIVAEQTFCTGVSLNLFLGQLGHYISLLSIDIAIALSSCLLQFLRYRLCSAQLQFEAGSSHFGHPSVVLRVELLAPYMNREIGRASCRERVCQSG